MNNYLRIFICFLVLFGAFYIIGLLFAKKDTQRAWEDISKKLTEDKRNTLTGKKKLSFVARHRLQAENALELSGSRMTFTQYLILVAVVGICGLIFGLVLDSPIFGIVLGVTLMCVPLPVLRIRSTFYAQRLDEQVRTAMSIITNSYLQSDDIIGAARENLKRIEYPLNSVFNEFVSSNTFIEANIVRNLRILKLRVDNKDFREWCDTLILCQDDRSIKYVLPAIVEQMSDKKIMQEELNTAMIAIYREYAIVACIVLGTIPLLRLINAEWFDTLIHTVGGQIVMCISIAITAWCGFMVMRVNKPLSNM